MLRPYGQSRKFLGMQSIFSNFHASTTKNDSKLTEPRCAPPFESYQDIERLENFISSAYQLTSTSINLLMPLSTRNMRRIGCLHADLCRTSLTSAEGGCFM